MLVKFIIEARKIFIEFVQWIHSFAEWQGDVDVVIAYVDGSDPEHSALRAAWLLKAPPKERDRNSSEPRRYLPLGELPYVVRSIDEFAPWVRKIHILTISPLPAGIAQHPKVVVVHHSRVIPAEKLPLFNSIAIETGLDLIPGLSEHFLYFNDDMFLGRKVRKSDFFTRKGQSVITYRSERFNEMERPLNEAEEGDEVFFKLQKQTALAVGRKLGVKEIYAPIHQLIPLRKSILAHCKKQFSEQVSATLANRFRDTSDFALVYMVYPAVASQMGAAICAHRTLVNVLHDHLYCTVSSGDPEKNLRLQRILRERPRFFCLSSEVDEPKPLLLKPFYEAYFGR